MDDPRRRLVITYAYLWIGRWYKWGGDDPSGIDCSGFVIECLKSVAILPRKHDDTAEGLFNNSNFKPSYYDADPEVRLGDLVFWKNDKGHICHVEIVIFLSNTDILSIGASGGGSKTLTVKDAIRDNAFIKRRSIFSRKNIAGFRNPYGD